MSLSNVFCRIGGVPVAALSASTAEVVCASPPLQRAIAPAVESVEVQVSFNGQDFSSASPPAHFAYYTHTLSSCDPAGGPADGGTVLTLRGVGFTRNGNASGVLGALTWHAADGTDAVVPLGEPSLLELHAAEFILPAVPFSGDGVALRGRERLI